MICNDMYTYIINVLKAKLARDLLEKLQLRLLTGCHSTAGRVLIGDGAHWDHLATDSMHPSAEACCSPCDALDIFLPIVSEA